MIFTPGHTLGYICLYLNQYKTLIAGDALNVVNGQLVVTPHHHPPFYPLWILTIPRISLLIV
ncbi:hypothetical protein UF75_4944 [Desulfosporosinus sp. I2]|nr:hypothetical protein UF75_4944 [Desulfosporosinus sp. I2]